MYDYSNTLHTSEAAALGGTFLPGSGPVNYFVVYNGTWWAAIRDRNNTSNKRAKSIVLNCPEITTTTTTAAPTTTTSTTTTTTEPPPNSYEYSATRCATGNPVTIYYSTNDLTIGQTYYLPGASPTECFTIDSYNGPSTNSPTYSFGGFAIDCFDEARCVQA